MTGTGGHDHAMFRNHAQVGSAPGDDRVGVIYGRDVARRDGSDARVVSHPVLEIPEEMRVVARVVLHCRFAGEHAVETCDQPLHAGRTPNGENLQLHETSPRTCAAPKVTPLGTGEEGVVSL